MIAAISMMRRRADITVEAFRRHWLHPHGTMTAELPGLRYYIQSHCIESPHSNALARELGVLGFPQLWFDDYAKREVAYTSPRIAECNVDSENFVGAVKRLVTEPQSLIEAPTGESAAGTLKVILLGLGEADPAWAAAAAGRVAGLDGVVGYRGHRLLEQAPAPASRIPPLDIPVARFAEAVFADQAALAAASGRFAADDVLGRRTAIYVVEDHVLL